MTSEFEASLVYKASSKIARALTQENPDSKKKKMMMLMMISKEGKK